MRRGARMRENKLAVRLATLANRVVKIVGAAIFMILAWYAFRYTQYMNPLGSEDPINVHDSMGRNLLFLGITIVVVVSLLVLERYLSPMVQRWIVGISATFMTIWVGGWGFWWITTVDRQPVGDQAFVYGGASYFMGGEYFFLQPGSYCAVYPHQLGLIALIEIFFQIVGAYNYFACQVFLVEMAVGIALLGYLLLRQISNRMTVSVVYCIMMLVCFPLFFYTGWVYGDIPCIFFTLLIACFLIKYNASSHLGWLVGIVISAILAVLARKNSLIMIVALCLTAGICAILKKDKKLIVAILLAAVLPGLSYQAVYKMYEVRSGIEHQDGFPAMSFIAMGMQERWGKFGWYTEYCKEVYFANEMDTKLAAEASKRDIKARLWEFQDNPSYAVRFYREKILSQWNAPLYQSLYFGAQYFEGKYPREGSLADKLNGEYFVGILGICDRLQFILYVGMLCYFLFGVRKDSNILQLFMAVTIIGGFFFSILWEAKARYIFPYYVMMFSYAGIGYVELLSQIQRLISRKSDIVERDNVIPFERVA